MALLALVAACACQAIGGTLQLISTVDPSQGPPPGGGGDSWAPILSPDGRYVLFASTANNLALNGTNALPLLSPARMNVFLRDRTAGTTTLVSANLNGTGGGNGDSWPSTLSTNGRYALFESSASDLVPGDTNGLTDIFVRDLVAGTTTLVSVSTNGGSANGVCRSSVMTPDGRFVAFVSEASNLVPGDTNGIADVFVRDLQAKTTTLASLGATAVSPPANSGIFTSSSELPDITPDGRFVAFYSTASNLVAGVQTVGDIYVRDLAGETTVWVSTYARTALQSVMGATSGVCFSHAISDDGQYVAFEARPTPVSSGAAAGLALRYNVQTGHTDVVHTNASVANGSPYEDAHCLDITPDGRFVAFIANTNGTSGATTCIEVWDGQTGAATLASANSSGAVPSGSICDWPTLNPSGQFVAFLSSATGLTTNLLAGGYHLYLRDTQAGTTTLLDADTNGVGSSISSATAPRLSADGRYVAFECPDAGIVPNDRNRDYDVFLRDTVAGTSELISARDASLPSLSPNGSSLLFMLSVSSNGTRIAFVSDADNLVHNDTNACRDVFVRDLLNGTNLLVSVAANGATTGDGPSTDPAISADGRYVAFDSTADNLVAGDTNKAMDVFLRDLQAGTTALISVNTSGAGQGNADSYSPMISPNGRYIVFRSKATNLASGSFSGGDNLFVRDVQSAKTYALTTTGAGAAAVAAGGRYIAFSGLSANAYLWDTQTATTVYTKTTTYSTSGIGISPDGNRLLYVMSGQLYAVDRALNSSWTVGAALSAGFAGWRFTADSRFVVYTAPLSGTNQVYLYDLQVRTNLLVSRDYATGGAGYGSSDSPDISSDGRFVAYRSAATDLVPGGTNGVASIYVYDRQTSATILLSASLLGPWAASGGSLVPVFSSDAQTLFFQSWASDIIAQDFNQGSDVLAYSLYAAGSIPVFSANVMPGTPSGPGAWLTWPVVPGRTYSVQYKNGLLDAQWQSLHGNITILGNQAWLHDASPGPGPRFYRVSAY